MARERVDPHILDLFETLTGPHRVPFGDPFWNELLACPTLRMALAQDAAAAADNDNPVMAHFGERMLSSNLRSGNLARLVQHTIHCLNLALEGDSHPSSAAAGAAAGSPSAGLRTPYTPSSSTSSILGLPGAATTGAAAAGVNAAGAAASDFFMLEAMNGMRLMAVFVGHLLARAAGDAEAVREHVQPFFHEGVAGSSPSSLGWSGTPSAGASTTMMLHATAELDGSGDGRNVGLGLAKASTPPSPTAPVVPTLVEALCRWLLCPSPHVHGEAKLEAVNLLLVLCASQLYGGIGLGAQQQQQQEGPTRATSLSYSSSSSGSGTLPRRQRLSSSSQPQPPGPGAALGGGNLFLDTLMREAVAQHERAQLQGGSAGDASAGLGFRLVSLLLGWFMQQQPSLVLAEGAEAVGSPWGTAVGMGVDDVERRKQQQQQQQQQEERAEGGKGLAGAFRSIYSYFGGAGGATKHSAAHPCTPAGASPRPPGPSRPAASSFTSLNAGTDRLSLQQQHDGDIGDRSTHSRPPSSSSASASGSGLLAVAAAVTRGSSKGKGGKTKGTPQLLPERSALLLLLLTYNHRGEGERNPFREAFLSLTDARYEEEEEDDETLLGHRRSVGALRVPFDRLYAALAQSLHAEQAALLFYSLMVGNPLFLDSTLARGDVELLFLPLLQQLYNTDKVRSPRQLYVLVIVLLILTQDAAFNVGIFRRILLPAVPWYKERHLTNISLGSLVILCVLRVLVYDLNRAKDLYLLSNCGAILLNLASQAERLHEYAALRLINVLTTVLRRFVALQDKLAAAAVSSSLPPNQQQQQQYPAAAAAGSPSVSAASAPAPSLTPSLEAAQAKDLDLLAEALRVLLAAFNICLRPSLLQQNLRLVHYLLYSRRELEPLLAHPAVRASGWLGEVPAVMAHFGRLFDETEETLSVEKAMALLERGARQLVSRRLAEARQQLHASMSATFPPFARAGWHEAEEAFPAMVEADPDLKFAYEEESDPGRFFVPYIWEVVVAQTRDDILWFPEQIRAFDAAVLRPAPPTDGSASTATAAGAAAAAVGGKAGGMGEQRQPHTNGGGQQEKEAVAPPVVLTMHV